MRQTVYTDLMAEYENPIEHACDVCMGQQWISIDGKQPDGLCSSAWDDDQYGRHRDHAGHRRDFYRRKRRIRSGPGNAAADLCAGSHYVRRHPRRTGNRRGNPVYHPERRRT